MLTWLCQIQIQVKALGIHQLFRTWCKLHSLICKEFSVHLGQNSAGICIFRNISLVYTYKKQCLYFFQTGSFHISNKNLIHTWRDQCNLRLGKTSFQKLYKFRSCNFFLSKDLYHAVKKLHNNSVYLSVFFFQGFFPFFFKEKLLFLQFFLYFTACDKLI